jgi:predicted MFS family arabinose efflux permease
MLATTNAMVAEYSNARHRNFSVAMMAAGFPLGAIVGGSIASVLLAYFDWRAVFLLGGFMTAALLPMVWYSMPESIYFLVSKRQPNALERVNATLKRMGHAVIGKLPDVDLTKAKSRWRDLFSPQHVRTTLLLTGSYLTHIMTFYFILKWIPKIVVDMGFSPALAGGVLVWANVGGAAGALLLGWLTHYFRVRMLVILALAGSVLMINVFGQGQASLGQLALIAGIAGFFTNAGVVGMYALFAQNFPTHLRAGGTGFAIGVGRAGAVLGPIIAGMLFEGGSTLVTVSFLMALGSLIAAFLILMLREQGAKQSAPLKAQNS